MLLSLFLVCHVFKCHHDLFEDEELRRAPPTTFDSEVSANAAAEPAERAPIRVIFAMDSINDRSLDTWACRKVGDVHDGKTCLAEDVFEGGSEKAKVIEATMENVRAYISKFVNVTRVPGGINPSGAFTGDHFSSNLQLKQQDNCDLYIQVVARPFGATSSTLATASSRGDRSSNMDDKGRSRMGLITINAAKMPSVAQNETSGDRQFFITLVHELMHVLAFSAGHFGNWLNTTKEKYQPPYGAISYTNSYGLEQKFIATPGLISWVNERFQVLDEGIGALGLELEDGGGAGTAGSHPNSRLYFTDIMQGKTYGPGYVSGIFFHSLQDSGWYDVDFSYAEELVYMNAKLHGNAPNQYVMVQPPKLTFPADYMCYETSSQFCYYDYSGKANCEVASEAQLRDKNDAAYNSKYPAEDSNLTKWYNPDGTVLGTEELLDFANVLIPNNAQCRDANLPQTDGQIGEMARKLHEVYGPTSVCAMSTIFNGKFGEILLGETPACFRSRCGTDKKIRITLDDDIEQLCTRPGKKIYSKKHVGYVKCPPASEACATQKKVQMINIYQVLPDRGPMDGQNFVNLIGEGLSKYTKLKVKIGEIELKPIVQTDTSVLCQVPELKNGEGKAVMKIPQTLYVSDPDFPDHEGAFPNFYTFVERSYSAGWSMATPASALLVLGCVLAFFI